MRKFFKGLFVFLLIISVSVGYVAYMQFWHLSKVGAYKCPDEEYKVVVYEKGSTFLTSDSRVRIILKKGLKTIQKHDTIACTDGGYLREQAFEIAWFNDRVEIFFLIGTPSSTYPRDYPNPVILYFDE